MPDTFDSLTVEYAGWCARNNLPQVAAEDHDPTLLTDDQRAWIDAFTSRWEVCKALNSLLLVADGAQVYPIEFDDLVADNVAAMAMEPEEAEAFSREIRDAIASDGWKAFGGGAAGRMAISTREALPQALAWVA